jgi:hypothetical protein
MQIHIYILDNIFIYYTHLYIILLQILANVIFLTFSVIFHFPLPFLAYG